ncbi:MAG: nucleotide exchange factor GrpE [Patescibacteria group bacterium]
MEDKNKVDSQQSINKGKCDCTDEFKRLRKQSEDYLNGWKRAKADYINLKKDTEKRSQGFIQMITASMVLELLPLNSHFMRAMLQVPVEHIESDWVKGIRAIAKELSEMLDKFNIKIMETKGKQFDPKYHEAVERRQAEECKPGEIIEEIEPGYLMKDEDKVIQPAKVIVASNESEEDRSDNRSEHNEISKHPDNDPVEGSHKETIKVTKQENKSSQDN